MVAFFDSIAGMFTGKREEPPAPLDMQAPVTPSVDAAAVNTAPLAANDEVADFSLTGASGEVLKRLLQSVPVTRLGHEKPTIYPVEKAELSSGMNAVCMIGDETQPVHGECVELNVTLAHPAMDYDTLALKNALPALLNAIPALRGRIKAKEAHVKPLTYADVEKEFDALLASKPSAFTSAEQTVVKQFFEANKGHGDDVNYNWDGEEVKHNEGKVNVRIKAKELPGDKDAVLSSDQQIVQFFTAHHDQILAHIKAKVLKLGVLKPEELAHLDMHVAATGWNIEVKFGTKPAKDVDEAGVKLKGEEYAKHMSETPLAKIDTKVIGKIFTESLIESNKELQPIMARILSGPMLAEILHKRLPNDPAVAAFIAKHDMFKNEVDKNDEVVKAVENHMVVVDEARIGKTTDGKQDQVSVSFELPVGMTLQQLMTGIANSKAQMGVDFTRSAAANDAQIGAGAGIAA